MLRSIAEQKLKLFRMIDALGQKELFELDQLIADFIETKMKEKEKQFSRPIDPEIISQSENSVEMDGFWQNIEEINENKQLLAFQNVHDTLFDLPSIPSSPQEMKPSEIENMLQNFRFLSMQSSDGDE